MGDFMSHLPHVYIRAQHMGLGATDCIYYFLFFCAVIKYHDRMYFMEERVYSELQFITGPEEDSTMVGGGGGSVVGRGN